MQLFVLPEKHRTGFTGRLIAHRNHYVEAFTFKFIPGLAARLADIHAMLFQDFYGFGMHNTSRLAARTSR